MTDEQYAELDRLAREVCLRRVGSGCQKCFHRGRGLEWAHVLSRRYDSGGLRWDELNCYALCPECHHHFTDHPGEFTEWIERQPGGSERLAYLRALMNSLARPDYDSIRARLLYRLAILP